MSSWRNFSVIFSIYPTFKNEPRPLHVGVWGSILILRQKNSCKIICVIFICGWRGASSIIFMGHCEQWHIWLESFLFFSSHLSLFPLQSRCRTPQYPRRRRRQPPASVQTRVLQYLHRCTLHFASLCCVIHNIMRRCLLPASVFSLLKAPSHLKSYYPSKTLS